MFGGMLLALGGWFGDWAVREWPRRPLYGMLMGAIGAGIVGFVFYIDWDTATLLRCVIVGLLLYVPFHFAERRLGRRR